MADTSTDPFPRSLQLFIQALIVYSIVTVCLETVPDYAAYRSFFWMSEFVVVVIFTVEYFARWLLAQNRLRYPFRFLTIIDALAILPFYLQFGVDLRALRALRLLRLFRILKMARYSEALQTLGEAFKRSRETQLPVDSVTRPRLLTIFGGKLTGYRATAEKVMNLLTRTLPSRTPIASTRELLLGD